MAENGDPRQRVVITGIGMIASVGRDREAVWGAVRQGQSGVRLLRGVKALPDDLLVAAQVDICPDRPGRLKPISLCMPAAAEAVADSGLDLAAYDPYRCGAAISGHMGDTDFVVERCGRAELIEPGKPPWWGQWYPLFGLFVRGQPFPALRPPDLPFNSLFEWSDRHLGGGAGDSRWPLRPGPGG